MERSLSPNRRKRTISMRAAGAVLVATGLVSGIIGYEVGGNNRSSGPGEQRIQPEDASHETAIEMQLILDQPVNMFNGSIILETEEGTKVWPNPLCIPQNKPSFDPFDINSYTFFTAQHTNRIPGVQQIEITPGMQLRGPTEPNEPICQEVYLTPNIQNDGLPPTDPESAHHYVLIGFAGQSNNGRGGEYFVGTTTFIERGKQT